MQTATPKLPTRTVFPQTTLSGPGCLRHLWGEAAAFGDRGLLVHGKSFYRSGRLAALNKHIPRGLMVVPHSHEGGEPMIAQLERLLSTARAARVKWVAAIGGGSVLDLGKAVAGLINEEGTAYEFHDGKKPSAGAVPFVAAPSTAGTGSEATSICVFTNETTGVKKSFRGAGMLPRVVLLDPELLYECPRGVIAAAGMDAFTQAVESAVSRFSTPFTRMLSLAATGMISRSLLGVYQGKRSLGADLLQGSYLAGIALENARLGLVHGLAHPLGARYGVGHGTACAVCLPAVLAFNSGVEGLFDAVDAELGMPVRDFVNDALMRLRIENPFAGKVPEELETIVAEILASGSTQANPRPVSAGDARRVLQSVFMSAGED